MQSQYAKDNLPPDLVHDKALQSIVLKNGEEVKVKSSAVLTIAKDLSGPWSLLYIFIIVPRLFRDGIYNLIARYRYSWFGKKDQCMIPSPELKNRFIE